MELKNLLKTQPPPAAPAPVENPIAEDPAAVYFRAAKAWDTDRLRSVEVARNRAYLACALCLLCVVALCYALVQVATAHDFEVVTIAYNEETHTVRPVRYSDEVERITSNEAFVRSQIYQFVQALESIDAADQSVRTQIVLSWADDNLTQVLDDLIRSNREFAGTAGRGGRVAVDVRVIAPLNAKTMHVQFTSSAISESGARTQKREFAAVIGYRFEGRQRTLQEAWLNPFGFKISSYRRDEAAPEILSK